MADKRNVEGVVNFLGSAKPTETPSIPTTVGEVMTSKVVTLRPGNSLLEAIGMMANNSFRHFPVVEDNAHLAGVVSDRDLLRAMNLNKDWSSTTIAQVMTQNVVKVKRNTPLSVAVEEILTRRIHCLPVVEDDDRVCGIVTSTDLLKAFQQVQKRFE
ncbi:MAG: CBS domain-containing protein [Deltaproteobacteria bacterium]|nr:CBS domain-containing protein [Deltaproteobacteria bacterium]